MTTRVHVLEIGQSAIGIIVPEDHLQVRFFAAGAPYDRLDGQIFRGEREVLAAARALLPQRTRGERRLAR
ncbi:hypothetical protein OPKNFCMD_2191 [Methylobacterium crusticola]|uniref:Uncharacterized protein n=1 Tax=Methylobacterium crusticola TaxID=1697972 RepID=A0ABQ4QXT9_9HYPH|nr:hypothetical protein OPKNFCMD_2191 [Methylobacterium crusticola]